MSPFCTVCRCSVPVKRIVEYYGKHMNKDNKARMRRAVMSAASTVYANCAQRKKRWGKG